MVPRLPTRMLIARLERITDLSHDLAQELIRGKGETSAASAMAEAIKRDAETVHRALKAKS
jgi:hypothetical protein